MRTAMRSSEAALPLQGLDVDTRQCTISVTTSQDFFAPPEALWDALLFYEEIIESPPLVLRVLLPRPIATEGYKFGVGREVRCRYEGGHLLKQVTEITPLRSYAFDVIEQDLALGGRKVLGGSYTLNAIGKGRTRVALTTRYTSPNQPRWLCRWIEAGVCHLFHRYLLTTIRSNLAHRQTKRGN